MSNSPMTEQLAIRAIDRKVAGRRVEYERETTRIVEATFTLIERTGSLDPSMRAILAEAGLSTQTFYRYFESKDELMLALLDEGRRRLMATLRRRMQRSSVPADQVRAWIEGVLAQASDGAAARTRPWVLSEQRLAEVFADEQQTSVDLLVELLHDPLRRLGGAAEGDAGTRGPVEAAMIYRLAFATLRAHLAAGTRPTAAESEAIVAFCLKGATQ